MSNPGATAPTDDDTDAAAAAAPPPDAAPDDASDSDDAGQPDVLCTITYDAKSGEFTLIAGDEDDDNDAAASGGDMGGAGEGAEGASPAAGGVASSPKGQTFTDRGPLLKAVKDMIDQAQSAGEGSAEDNFSAGFNSSSAPTPKA